MCGSCRTGCAHFMASEWVSVQGLTSHLTHNRSFRRRVFPGNELHWYWQPKTIKHDTKYTRNTKKKQQKTVLANKTIYTLIWYGFYYLRSGNGVGPILTAPEPTRVSHLEYRQIISGGSSSSCKVYMSHAFSLQFTENSGKGRIRKGRGRGIGRGVMGCHNTPSAEV